MKSEVQIESFLAHNKVKSDIDLEGIKSYCQKNFGMKITYDGNYDTSEGVNAGEFKEWLENGFASGDIVYNNGIISLLGACKLNKAQISAFIDANEQLIETHTETSTEAFKTANTGDKQILLHLLSEKGKLFDVFTGKISDRYTPQNWERVNIELNNQKYIAIIREIDKDDRVILCCLYNLQTKELQYQPKMYFCNLNECTFFPSEEKDKFRLIRALAKVGKKWNDRMKRIQPMSLDDNSPRKHWYINDNFQVISKEINSQMRADMLRKSAGNFFTNPKDAEDLRDVILEFVKDVLARPEENLE